MRLKTLLILLSLVVLFVFSGCSGGGSDDASSDGGTSTTVTTGITGTISDMSGSPLEGAKVFVGSSETLTDENGEFAISTSASDISLTAELANYVQNNRIVTVVDGKLTEQNLKLSKIDTVKSFDATVGASINAQDATVDLPVNSYVLDDGSAYTGEVTAKVTYNRVTTVTGKEAFPGEFIGQESDSNDTKVLQSYGFINVTLESKDGKDLNLADNSTATLTYPMDSTIEDTPATIPLWYFDTTKGIWIEDGLATYDSATNTYSGSVTHFSTWNLDAKFDGASLKGCVEDANGQMVADSDLYLSTSGWGKHIKNDDVSGEFELINAPSNISLSIVAKVDDLASLEQNLTLSPGETRSMDGCLVVDVNASELFTSVIGKVVDGDNNPISNQYMYIYSVIDGTTTNLAYDTTNSSGEFEFSFKRSNIEDIKLSTTLYVNAQAVAYNNYYTIDPTQATSDVGSVVLATTTVNGCVILENGSSTTSEGNTTLADGVTTVDDGTVVSGDGFTIFGTDSRILAGDSPYDASFHSSITFNQSGTFSFVIPTDNLSHSLYAHVYNIENEKYTLTGKLDVLANKTTKDLTDIDECIQLHKMKSINESGTASISTTHSNVYLEVVFSKEGSSWGTELIGNDSKVKSGTFSITKNGTYTIKQVVDGYENVAFNGTMSLSVDGKSYTITIPEESSGSSEWWTAFSIEAYDGNIKVTEVNKAW